MAIRITGTLKSPRVSPIGPDYSREYTVNIYDNDFSGSPTSVNILACNIQRDSAKPEDRYSPIFGGRASVSLHIPATDATLTTFIEDLAYGEEARFLLEITMDDSPNDVWRGIIIADQSAEDDIDPFPFKISAICGIAALKDIPFLNFVFGSYQYYQGRTRFIEILINAMSKMPHASFFWTGSDVFLRTAVDWWSTAMSSGVNDDALWQSGVDMNVFTSVTQDGSIEDDVLSCYDVVSEILKAFGCMMYQSEGVWRIDQIPYRSTSPYRTRDYTVAGAFISGASNTNVNVINQTIAGSKLTLINYDFLPMLKKARVIYEGKKRRNIISGKNLDQDSDLMVFNQFVDSNGGDTIVRLRGLVNYSITNNSYSGGASDKIFLVPNATLKIGNNYLRRNYTISNFTANLQNAVWDTSSANRVHFPHLTGTVPAVGETTTGYFSFEVLSFPLPADGDDNSLFFTIGSLLKWNGTAVTPGQLSTTWSVMGLYLDVFDEGVVTVQEDQVLFEAVNPSDATAIYETKLRIGNSDTVTGTSGRIYYTADGTTWAPADLWGQGSDARTSHICDILALNILNGQLSARRRMNGAIYGGLRDHRLMQTTDGRIWLQSRLDWNLAQNTMSGSWTELEFGGAGVSSTPIKIKVVKSGASFPTISEPSNPNGLSSTGVGFSTNPSPAVLAPVSYNALDGEIFVGDTVTSIPIKTPSDGNEFLAGDSVGIVNPFTGLFQYFEIATPPSVGDTSLSVVSSISSYEFCEDSYLVISQKPYAFTPGNWYTFKGNIGATTAHRVFVTGFDLPANDDACFAIVRRQVYQSPDDYTLNLVDNSLDFLSSLNLNGQVAYVKAYA